MAKYDRLGVYLNRLPLETRQQTLTFHTIEEIIGQDMECSAFRSFTSWDNRGSSKTNVRQNSWLNSGWKTIMVDIETKSVKFQRN